VTLAADALEVVAVLLYLVGVRRLARRGRRWAPSSTAAFIAGVVSMWVAVGSPLAGYDDVSAPVHVAQHALLMMIAPPLMAAGRPLTLAIQAAHRPTHVRIVKVVHSRAVASLTNPVAGWVVYYGAMAGCFLDRRVYSYLLSHPLAHDASHFGLLVIGYLYWQPLIGGEPSRWRLSHQARMASALAGTGVEAALGIAMMTFSQPLSPINTLGDTHAGGTVFLVLALSTCAMCSTVMTRSRRPVQPVAGRLAIGVASSRE
jgi:cytochrome c oxidase assembly factor CtaG